MLMADPFHPYAEHFIDPKGPGDARPTAQQIISDNDLLNNLTGKVALVTGATSGIGIETARALFATGMDVFITARDLDKANSVINDIKSSEPNSGGKLHVIEIDMSSLASVKTAAQDFLSKSNTLNILVNNAGIAKPSEGRHLTADGYEQHFAINHLAPFTLTALLLPTLLRSSTPAFNSRVVNLTSDMHIISSIHLHDVNLAEGYDSQPGLAYGHSKTAAIWMTNYIDRVYGPRGLHANSVHPGFVRTPILQDIPKDAMVFMESDPKTMAKLQTPEQGAAGAVWAAVGKVWEGGGGEVCL